MLLSSGLLTDWFRCNVACQGECPIILHRKRVSTVDPTVLRGTDIFLCVWPKIAVKIRKR